MAQQQNLGQNQAMLIRPQQIDSLPHFNPDQKQHYKTGLTQLWNTLETTQPGSPQYNEAEQKIRQASMKIMQQLGKNPRPASGGGPQQGARPQGQQGGNPQQGGVAMAQQGSSQGPGQGGQAQVVPQSQGQQQLTLSQQSRSEINQVPINIPVSVQQQGEVAVNSYRAQWFRKAVDHLTRRDQARTRGAQLQQMSRSGQVNGQNIEALQREMEKMKNEMMAATSQWQKMKDANAAAGQQAGAQGMQRQQSAGGQGQPGVNGQPGQMQQDVNVSPQQPQGAFPQQQPPTSQPAVAPSPVQQHPQQNMTQQPNAAQNYPQQQNMAQQQGQQPQGQPQRPQMNAQQMAQAQAQQNMQQQQQHQNMQNSAAPQSATQQQPPQQPQQQQQRPQPLTHQAAVNQAAQSYSREQAAQQAAQQQGSQQNMPQLQNGQMSLNAAPQSATQTTPNSAYPTMQPNTHGGSTTKFPIPKQLQLDGRAQVPVPGPPSRPTYQSSGMMQQPGIQKQAQFTLEGEGDRVLSRSKLNELVRQVTGTPAPDPSSDSHALAPDVEEAVLTLADDFIDNVIIGACRLAKMRNSQTLDIRDVQVILERNYGIRIPGLALDEVRTVRKFQPAPGWTSKMQAVHSAKVMSNTTKDS